MPKPTPTPPAAAPSSAPPERQRLAQDTRQEVYWKRRGPHLADRTRNASATAFNDGPYHAMPGTLV